MPAELTKQLADINAAVVLARTLVHASCAGADDRFRKILDRARYCQLVATRMGLPMLRVHKLDLASWLSGLPESHEARKHLAVKYGVEPLLQPTPASETDPVEGTIITVVRAYQKIAESDPDAASDSDKLRTLIEQQCACFQGDITRKVIRYLFRILRDEAFVFGSAPISARVLVVDPEEAVSPVVASLLIERGHQVRVVGDAETALNVIKQQRFDLILCELQMPFLDGIGLCRRLKQEPDTALIPLVITTSSKSRNVQRKCLLEGAEDVLAKPVDTEILFLKMKNWLARSKQPMPADAAVTGSLADVAFADLIQLVTSAGRTMTIMLTRGSEKGEVSISNGEVVHAELGSLDGEPAFYAFMRWKDGAFCATKKTPERRTINAPVMGLLMEGARLADEAAGDGT